MPRQNGVTPFGNIIATPERGTFFGNRGVLHDASGRIKRPWQVKWGLLCLVQFKGRKRQVMRPGSPGRRAAIVSDFATRKGTASRFRRPAPPSRRF